MMEQLLSITYTVDWTIVVDEQRATSLTREVLHVHGKRERECVYVCMCGISVVRHCTKILQNWVHLGST